MAWRDSWAYERVSTPKSRKAEFPDQNLVRTSCAEHATYPANCCRSRRMSNLLDLQQGENVCEVKSQQIPHAKQHKA